MSAALDMLAAGDALIRSQFGETAAGDLVTLHMNDRSQATINCAAVVDRQDIGRQITNLNNEIRIWGSRVTISKAANPQLVAILAAQQFQGVPEGWTITVKGIEFAIVHSEVDPASYNLVLEGLQ